MAATRRNFFSWTRNALAATGLVGAAPMTAEAAAAGEDYYAKLGVTKIVNAAGTYTALTASIMPPSVQAAVAEAAKHPVRLAELQQKAGEYIARRLKCEAALVSAGAASALTLGTADEVAGMALYLASEAGAFATGQAFVVDGGFIL